MTCYKPVYTLKRNYDYSGVLSELSREFKNVENTLVMHPYWKDLFTKITIISV